MTEIQTEPPAVAPGAPRNTGRFKPVELEIELFCRGIRIDPSVDSVRDGRRIARTRAGLGSGLELVLTGSRGEIWLNAPVLEPFAAASPFRLTAGAAGTLQILDERSGERYPTRLPPEPAWYSLNTSRGTPMSRVGVLQGTYLGIYVSNTCMYWYGKPEAQNCRFCTTGGNVGVNEIARKDVDDVVEVARAARRESGVVFTHFNCGYAFEEDPRRRRAHGLMQAAPFVQAVREEVGGFIGVQAVPVTRENYDEYDQLIDLGADHFSFCFELYDQEWFEKICPGKARTVGQKAFFDAMEYTAKKLGKGRVAGEIIAGLEPVACSKAAIDRIVDTGAFPTVCIFRPVIGSDLEWMSPPDPDAMKEVMAYQYEACRRAGIPIGVLPGIEVSLVVQPEEGRELAKPAGWPDWYELKLKVMRSLAVPYTRMKQRPSGGARVPVHAPGKQPAAKSP
jgi:hypothetical protein